MLDAEGCNGEQHRQSTFLEEANFQIGETVTDYDLDWGSEKASLRMWLLSEKLKRLAIERVSGVGGESTRGSKQA